MRQRRKRQSLSALAWVLVFATSLVSQAAEQTIEQKDVVMENGDSYVGEMLNGFRHGQGVYTWKDGRGYQGQFVSGKRAGSGALNWPNGNSYNGTFSDNLMHGTGIFTWANQDRYEGAFIEGKRTGKGIYIWKLGDSYEGEFLNGQLQGRGTFSWADGRVYRGGFIAGLKSGTGHYEWPNNNRYDGVFEDDERHGPGVYFWRDGTVYHGHFAHNRTHGYGVKVSPDGLSEFQSWEDGKLLASRNIHKNPRCTLVIEELPWMFESEECINGLAHGSGPAISLDGSRYLAQASIILGKLVNGKVELFAQATSKK